MFSRYHDGSACQAPAECRARPIRAIVVLALALLISGLQPWIHGYSGNASVIGSSDIAVVMPADLGSGGHDADIPAAGHCLLHAGCAVSLDGKTSMLPVSYRSDWPVFITSPDIGLRPSPDPKPPKFMV